MVVMARTGDNVYCVGVVVMAVVLMVMAKIRKREYLKCKRVYSHGGKM